MKNPGGHLSSVAALTRLMETSPSPGREGRRREWLVKACGGDLEKENERKTEPVHYGEPLSGSLILYVAGVD